MKAKFFRRGIGMLLTFTMFQATLFAQSGIGVCDTLRFTWNTILGSGHYGLTKKFEFSGSENEKFYIDWGERIGGINTVDTVDGGNCVRFKHSYVLDNHAYKALLFGLGANARIRQLSFFSPYEGEDSHIISNPTADLTSIDVSGCTALTELNCHKNQLKSIDVSKNKVLEKLKCSLNRLTSIDVSGCTALAELDCSSNSLDSLDASKNKVLKKLNCSLNRLTSIDVSGCTALAELDCSYNSLDSLDVSKNIGLKKLDCAGNYLDSLDVSKNTTLAVLDCGNNQFTTLDLSGHPALRSLNCDKNPLTSLNVSGCTQLTALSHYSNSLTNLNASNCTSLKKIDCCSGESTDSYYRCTKSRLTSLNVSNCTSLTELENLYGSKVTSLDVSGCTKLTTLRGRYGLKDLKASNCTALTELRDFSRSQLRTLDVSGCTKLKGLDCGYNQLTILNVSGCNALTDLYCGYNQLTILNVSGCNALASLSCGSNQLSELDVKNNPALICLYCDNNRLTDIDLRKNTILYLLECSGNKLTTLDVSNNTQLEKLDCSQNHLTTLDVSNNTQLGTLDCSQNRIPLSVIYKIYNMYNYYTFSAQRQSDSIVTLPGEFLDLSSEKNIGQKKSTYTVFNNDGEEVPAGKIYIETGFVFRFNEPVECYRIVLENPSVPNASFTYYVSALEKLPENYFNVRITSNNAEWGQVSRTGYGVYKKEEETTITAVPNKGYHFVAWTTKDGSVFSTDSMHTFKVTENIELTANFKADTFRVQLSANSDEWGSISQSGSGTYETYDEITITAIPNDGYHFVSWTEKDGSVFSTKSVHTFKITENLELTANFAVMTFTVLVSGNPEEWGQTLQSGNGTYERYEEVTITATPNPGYYFDGWVKKTDWSVFSTNAVHTFKVTEDLELIANFEQQNVDNSSPERLALKIHPNPSHGEFQIELLKAAQIEVYSAAGHLVQRKQAQTGTFGMSLESGVYYLRVLMRDGVIVRKVVVL